MGVYMYRYVYTHLSPHIIYHIYLYLQSTLHHTVPTGSAYSAAHAAKVQNAEGNSTKTSGKFFKIY